MTSVTQVEDILKQVLEIRANELAQETGFVQRERKLSGADFVQILAFGHLHNPQATLSQLTQVAQLRDVQITSSGLHQRCTQAGATFLQAVLAELVEKVVAVPAAPISLFKPFKQVLIEDSSTIVLPAALAEQWPGCGGGSPQQRNERAEAALKLHVRWDLKSGQLFGPHLSAGRISDLQSPFGPENIPARSLLVTDRGYWSLKRLRDLEQRKIRFCAYPKSNTVFRDRHGKRIELHTVLPRVIGRVKVMWVSLGERDPLLVRLLMVRVPTEVVEQRRERLTAEAQDKGRQVSLQQWELAQWTLIVTNASAKHVGVKQALVLLRARWAIELLFKLWKSQGKIDEWRSQHPWRALCELFGKLIAVVIQHWLLLFGCWQDPWRSLVKASAVVRCLALDCVEVLRGMRRLHTLIRKACSLMQSGCQVNRRASDPCLAQLLLEELDWLLT